MRSRRRGGDARSEEYHRPAAKPSSSARRGVGSTKEAQDECRAMVIRCIAATSSASLDACVGRRASWVLSHLEPPYHLVALLLYGCGLRLSECLELCVQRFNLEAMLLTVHDGKGQKDRTVSAATTRFAGNSRSVGCRSPAASGGLGLRLYRCVSSPATEKEIQERREANYLAVVFPRQRD